MKSPFHFFLARSSASAAVFVTLAVTLAGCGQKGPLYLGKPPERIVRTAPVAAAQDNSDEASAAAGAADRTDGTDGSSTGADTGNTATPQK